VAQERDVVDRRLDAHDQGLLVVERDGDWSHVMLQARFFNAGVDVVAHLIGVVAGELAAQTGGHIGRFDGMHGGAHQALVERPRGLLAM